MKTIKIIVSIVILISFSIIITSCRVYATTERNGHQRWTKHEQKQQQKPNSDAGKEQPDAKTNK